MGNVELESSEFVNFSTTKVDLTLLVSTRADQLDGVLLYNADIFKAATVERMSRLLQVGLYRP